MEKAKQRFLTGEWLAQEFPGTPMYVGINFTPFFTTLRKYFPSPSMYILCPFEPDRYGSYQAKMIVRHDEARAMGQKIIDMLICPQYWSSYHNDLEKSERKIIAMSNQIFKRDYPVEKYSTKKIVDIFEKFAKCYYDYFKYACFQEGISMQGEHILATNISRLKIELKDLGVLFIPTEDSYSLDILKSLRDCKAGLVTPAQHSEKYHWCQNNYFEIKYFSTKDVLDELEDHSLEYYQDLFDGAIRQKEEMLKQKEEILSTLPKYFQDIVRITTAIGAKLTDDRKKTMLTCFSAFDKLLCAIAEQTKTAIADIRLLIPQELRHFVSNPTAYKQRFQERNKLALLFQSDFPLLDEIIDQTGKIPQMNEPFFAEGDVAEKALQQLNARLNIYESDISINNKLKGVVAHKNQENEIIGTVRIIKNPKSEILQNGEILVAPHTTPDFLNAMHKSSAIVVDWGGQTSHAAIVSRELKKPCIIGTNYASSVLQTGQKVKINFIDGTVEVV